jgi:hypothetical protein
LTRHPVSQPHYHPSINHSIESSPLPSPLSSLFSPRTKIHPPTHTDELRAVFPPRSLCAQGGLACALETRQVRLAYYVNELVNTKLPRLPLKAQGAVLRFLEGGFAGAVGEGEAEEEDEDEDDGGAMRKSLTALADEEKNLGAGAMIEVEGRVARRSPRAAGGKGWGADGERSQQLQQAPWAVLDAEGRAAYERLRATLTNGIPVVKVIIRRKGRRKTRRGWSTEAIPMDARTYTPTRTP